MKISKETIISSILEYNNHSLPVLTSALESNAMYFPCIVIGGETLFCLSRFCQFVGATLPNYIECLQQDAKGDSEVQRMIADELNQSWINYGDAPQELQQSFKTWMGMVNPRYAFQNAKFILLK